MRAIKTVYCTTMDEYNRFDPDKAKEHAARDIRSGEISVFFLSTEEVPTPLLIEDELENLPPFMYVAIGGGCTDEINALDASDEYRAAFQRAVRYGELYNEAIARHFSVKQKSGPAPASQPLSINPTRAFLGAETGWDEIRMELKDIQGPFGGRDVTVSGTGRASVRVLRPGSGHSALEEKVYKIRLAHGAVKALVEAFIVNNFLALVLPDETMEPDTGRPVITLVNGKGQSHTLAGWERTTIFPDADPKDPIVRFDRIYKQLLRIERLALEPPHPDH